MTGEAMVRVTYSDHTVELISTQDPVTGKWSPKANVMFINTSGMLTHKIQPLGTYDTEAAANETALEKAKAWIDQGKR